MAAIDIPLTDPRISPLMQRYLQKKGFCLKEFHGFLMVIGEEDGEMLEMGYDLFCAITQTYYADELTAMAEPGEEEHL